MKAAALIAASLAALLAMPAAAQEPATVTGRVTNAQGRPEGAAQVRISVVNVGASTDADGNYRIVVPGSRIRPGQPMTITASRAGLLTQSRSITLGPGARVTQNFQFEPAPLRSRGSKPRGKGRSQ